MNVVLKNFGLKETVARKCVINALQTLDIPSDATTIHSLVAAHGHKINVTTVYRVLEVLLKHHIIHRHPSTGNVVLCKKLGQPGHHRFLRCEQCNVIKEFIDHGLSKEESRIAAQHSFASKHHLSEIIGICKQCSS